MGQKRVFGEGANGFVLASSAKAIAACYVSVSIDRRTHKLIPAPWYPARVNVEIWFALDAQKPTLLTGRTSIVYLTRPRPLAPCTR